jgi:hypothetical protein
MATTSKELVEILQKYTKPDDIVIWQYYTRGDFDYEDYPAISNKQFAKIADSLGGWDLWDGVAEQISEAIYNHQNKKGQE